MHIIMEDYEYNRPCTHATIIEEVNNNRKSLYNKCSMKNMNSHNKKFKETMTKYVYRIVNKELLFDKWIEIKDENIRPNSAKIIMEFDFNVGRKHIATWMNDNISDIREQIAIRIKKPNNKYWLHKQNSKKEDSNSNLIKHHRFQNLNRKFMVKYSTNLDEGINILKKFV